MPSLGTYGPHSLKLIHLTLASIWCSVENFFLVQLLILDSL